MPFFSRNKKPKWPRYMMESILGFLLMIFLMYILAPTTEGTYIKDHLIEIVVIGVAAAVVVKVLVDLYDRFQGYDL
jgi:heme/copper-type cytochrome/quinol oxidase subunit 4